MARLALVVVLSLVAIGCGGGSDTASDAALGAETAADDAADTEDAPQVAGTEVEEAAGADDEAEEADGDPKEEAELLLPPSDPDADDAPSEVEEEPAPDGPPLADLPGGRYVQLDAVQRDGDSYAVAFTTFNFDPVISTDPDDYHVHFFFDDLEPENAGTNGPNPGQWFLYDGPSPFSGYTVDDKPETATRMCALVADSAHGVTVGSGNCVALP